MYKVLLEIGGVKVDENKKWLLETGYKISARNGNFYFEYADGHYRAFTEIALVDVINAPLECIQNKHYLFMEKAENLEIF